MYNPGVTVYGAKAARLEWRDDNHIVLTSVEGTAEAPVYETLFDVAPTQVTKVTQVVNDLVIVVAGKKYRMSANGQLQPWIEKFTTNGVTVRRYSFGKLFLWSFLAIVAILVAAFAMYWLLDEM